MNLLVCTYPLEPVPLGVRIPIPLYMAATTRSQSKHLGACSVPKGVKLTAEIQLRCPQAGRHQPLVALLRLPSSPLLLASRNIFTMAGMAGGNASGLVSLETNALLKEA